MGSAPDGAPASTRSVYSLGAAAAGPARGPARRPGESWSWVRPEPARTRARGSTLGRPGRGLVTVGLVLVVLGLVLAAVAFGLGLTVDEIRSALGGGR